MNTCVVDCDSGFYGNPTDHLCKNCDFSCSTCSGPSINQCTSCS